MKKREKIIIGTATVAVIYAVYVLFFTPSPKKEDTSTLTGFENVKTFAKDMNHQLGANDLLTREKYILVQAAENWNRELFLRSEHLLTPAKDLGQTAQKME